MGSLSHVPFLVTNFAFFGPFLAYFLPIFVYFLPIFAFFHCFAYFLYISCLFLPFSIVLPTFYFFSSLFPTSFRKPLSFILMTKVFQRFCMDHSYHFSHSKFVFYRKLQIRLSLLQQANFNFN